MAADERLTIAGPGIELNGDDWQLEAFDRERPTMRTRWLTREGGGALPVERDRDLITWTARLRAVETEDMDEALERITALEDALEVSPFILEWQPAESDIVSEITVHEAVIVDLPIVRTGDDSGWFLAEPVIAVEFKCDPWLVSQDTVTATGDLDEAATDPYGEIPANGATVLSLTNKSGVPYRRVEIAEDFSSGQLVFDEPANEGSTLTGVVGVEWVNAFEIGVSDLHGRYRVNCELALDDGQVAELQYRFEFTGAGLPQFSRIGRLSGIAGIDSPGVFNIRVAGILRLQVRAATGTLTLTDSPVITRLALIPETAQVLRSRTGRVATSIIGADPLAGSGALHGHTALAGGDWSTSGATGDFLLAVDHVGRQYAAADTGNFFDLANGRLARLATPADVRDVHVSADFFVRGYGGNVATHRLAGLVARYSASTDRLVAGLRMTYNAGVPMASAFISTSSFAEHQVLLSSAFTSSLIAGRWVNLELVVIGSTATLFVDGTVIATYTHSRLGIAGAVATGKTGFYSYLSGPDPYWLVKNWRSSSAAGNVVHPVWPNNESIVVYPDRDATNVDGPILAYSGKKLRPGSTGSRLIVLASETDEPALAGPVDADWSLTSRARSLTVPR